MLFWVIAALLTVALVLALSRPLARRATAEPAAASAVRIYKDQLTEIAADEARGLIGPAEAEAARIEVSRRLLAAAGPANTAGARSRGSEMSASLLIRGLALALPLSAIGLYLAVGQPDLPDQPYAMRVKQPDVTSNVAELVGRVEKRLRERPDDGQGWDVIAPIYLRQERFKEAAYAFARAIDLLGETPKRLTGLGEALVYQNGGIVTEEARRAWVRMAELAPDQPEPKFWMAVADEQDGRFARAADAYRELIARAPANAPWRATVAERLASVEKRLGSVMRIAPQAPGGSPAAGAPMVGPTGPSSAGGTARGPTAADVAAAQQMAPADRQQMIEQMVGALSERLKQNGADPDGWERLVRSYAVLGRKDDARRALLDGRKALAGDASGLARIEALAKSLGIEG